MRQTHTSASSSTEDIGIEDEKPTDKYLRADGIDGLRWHSVVAVDADGDYPHRDQLETACGLTVRRADADDVRSADEKPELSGNTICYECVRSPGGSR